MANKELSMESIDSGSNYSFGDKLIKPNAPKAAFNLSHLSTMTIDNAGIVFPICSPIETIMGDDFDINVKSLLRVLPQEIPLYSRQRMYIYAFYCRNSDLWKNWNTFMRKGNIGQTIKKIPTLNATENLRQTNSSSGVVTVDSLADYMGLPIGLNLDEWDDKINALPFFMYLKIWRDYFCNKNEFVNDKVLFPDNDDEFRLNDDGQIISAAENSVQVRFDFNNDINGISGNQETTIGDDTSEQTSAYNGLTVGLFYHNYPDDRFTDALPWPIRGSTPTIPLNLEWSATGDDINLMTNTYNGYTYTEGEVKNIGRLYFENADVGETQGFIVGSPTLGDYRSTGGEGFTADGTSIQIGSGIGYGGRYGPLYIKSQDIADVLTTSSSNLSLTLNQIRELAIEQTELEKMARTDGTYLGFAMTFFGERPKNAEDYRPVYIGGTYTDITFTEVLQTSSTSGESSPLGTYAGHGIAVNNDGYIGHVHCDDYGWIMLLGCIMPDVYYGQGIKKELTRSLQSDFYLPERAKLGMIPVLNHEIYALNTGDDFDNNFDMFAWNNPFDELRYRANEIHGKIADSSNASFSNYTQARFFTTQPNWGKEFSEASEVSKDYLSAGDAEVAYTAQFKIDIKAVRAVPYKAIPAQII